MLVRPGNEIDWSESNHNPMLSVAHHRASVYVRPHTRISLSIRRSSVHRLNKKSMGRKGSMGRGERQGKGPAEATPRTMSAMSDSIDGDHLLTLSDLPLSPLHPVDTSARLPPPSAPPYPVHLIVSIASHHPTHLFLPISSSSQSQIVTSTG
jgi:hypothetical protein